MQATENRASMLILLALSSCVMFVAASFHQKHNFYWSASQQNPQLLISWVQPMLSLPFQTYSGDISQLLTWGLLSSMVS